jgi:multiple sugar transport system substrate-binding protein
MKRQVAVVVLLLVALGLFAAGQREPGAQKGAEPVTIPWMSHFWHEPGYGEWQKAAVAAFEEKYPGAKIEIVDLPWESLIDQELISLSSPEPAGLVFNWIGNLGQFAGTGLLEPLDSYLAKTDIPKRFVPSTLKYAKDKDGNTVAMPNQMTTAVFYYRQDLLDKAGLKVPTTLEETYQYAKKLTDASAGIYGYGIRCHSEGSETEQEIFNFTRGFGGNFAKDGVPTVNSPAVVEALKYSRRYLDEKLSPIINTESTLRGMLVEGKIAFKDDAPHMKLLVRDQNPGLYDKLQVGLMPTPGHVGGPLILCFYSIPKNFKYKDWAFKVLEFISQNEWGDKFTEQTKNPYATGHMPESVLKENPWMNAIIEQAKYSEPSAPPGLEQYSVEFESKLTPYLVESLLGSRPVQQVMDEAQKELVAWANSKK